MYTPVNPNFTIMKVGCKGVYITRTCNHDDSDGVLRGTLKLRDCMPMKDVKVMHLLPRCKIICQSKY